MTIQGRSTRRKARSASGGRPNSSRSPRTKGQPAPALLKLHGALHLPPPTDRELQALRRIGNFHTAVGTKVVQDLPRGVSLGSAAELAAQLNRKPETVRRWLRKGVLPANVIGGRGRHTQLSERASSRAAEPTLQGKPGIGRGNRFSSYAGQWIAVRGGAVVAAGVTPADVVNRLHALDAMAESMFRVPDDNTRAAGVVPR